jgi:16S rRNA (adenine(1408)-N(1))-methyltransferase
MDTLHGKEIRPLDAAEFRARIAPYARVALDLGTGDGRYVYRQAQAHPDTFYVGVDATRENLAEYSAKIGKKPSRGGLPNVLYVLASAEALPPELAGVADQISINFPWGSLMAGLIRGDPALLASIARAARPGATLDIYLNTAVFADPIPLDVLGLPEVTLDYVQSELMPRYAAAGIRITAAQLVGKEVMAGIPSLWARRLAFGKAPQTVYIGAVIGEEAGAGVG